MTFIFCTVLWEGGGGGELSKGSHHFKVSSDICAGFLLKSTTKTATVPCVHSCTRRQSERRVTLGSLNHSVVNPRHKGSVFSRAYTHISLNLSASFAAQWKVSAGFRSRCCCFPYRVSAVVVVCSFQGPALWGKGYKEWRIEVRRRD